MKLKFKFRSPNFAITDKGKFSLGELDATDFNEYLAEVKASMMRRRQEQRKIKLRPSGA
jgi:hypothetical protein